MSQENNSINKYTVALALALITFQGTIINLDTAKPIKNSPIDHTTQHLITILRNDDASKLQNFLSDNKGYDFNKLRNGLWTSEKSTALIDCVVLDAYKCLRILLSQDKFKGKGLKSKSSHGFYPLDYALNPTIKTKILDALVEHYLVEHYNDPEKYISAKYLPEYKKYQSNRTD